MKKFQCMQSFILQKKSNAITLKVEYFFTIYFTINIYFQRKTSAIHNFYQLLFKTNLLSKRIYMIFYHDLKKNDAAHCIYLENKVSDPNSKNMKMIRT